MPGFCNSNDVIDVLYIVNCRYNSNDVDLLYIVDCRYNSNDVVDLLYIVDCRFVNLFDFEHSIK